MKQRGTRIKQGLNRLIALLPVIILLSTQPVQAQDTGRKVPGQVKFSGALGITQDFFTYSSNDSLYYAYRPKFVTRFFGNTSLTIGKFSLPFSISYTLQEKRPNYTTPIPDKFNIKDLLNNYNQLSFSPTFGSFTLNLGTQVPKYSELTSGNLPVFGIGGSWKPRKFRLAAYYGMSQRGISTDSLTNTPGSYKRMSMGGKIGVGHEDSSHFYLVVLKHKDNVNSATVTTEGIRPQENLVASIDQKLVLFKRFYIAAEVAASAFTSDLKDGAIESDSFHLNASPFILNLFNPRYTSCYGAAGTGSVGYNGKYWGVRGISRLYSSDYHTLNYPFLQSDRFEWMAEPWFNLFKGRVAFNGSIGKREDNLTSNKISKAYQTLALGNLNLQVTKRWSLRGMYTNFGFRNSITNDTFRVQNVSQNYNISSSYIITGTRLIHSIIGSYMHDNYNDYNIVSGRLSDVTNQMYFLNYSLAFQTNPLVISITGSHFENKLYLGTMKIQMGSLMATYSIGKQKNMSVSLGGNYTKTSLINYTPDETVSTNLILSGRIAKKLSVGANTTYNIYRYGSVKPGVLNKENSIRLFATYSF